jgi:uncharacterized protein (DUF983 family)
MPIPFTCPHCGLQTMVLEQYAGRSGACTKCGGTITVPGLPALPAYNVADDAGMRLLLPVGRSPWAIAAGYAGLFAVLCVTAPIALVLGIVAIRDLKRHPEKHGMGRAIFGLVMGILFSIPGIFVIIALIFHPKWG